MRLIDADALLNSGFPTIYHTEFGDEVINTNDIRNAPTVEEIPTGEWIKTPELFRDRICSHCKRQISYEQIGDFCIKCGAKMKGEEE